MGIGMFVTASTEPDADSQDNVENKFRKVVIGNVDRILKWIYYMYLIIEYSLVEI